MCTVFQEINNNKMSSFRSMYIMTNAEMSGWCSVCVEMYWHLSTFVETFLQAREQMNQLKQHRVDNGVREECVCHLDELLLNGQLREDGDAQVRIMFKKEVRMNQ